MFKMKIVDRYCYYEVKNICELGVAFVSHVILTKGELKKIIHYIILALKILLVCDPFLNVRYIISRRFSVP